MIVISLFENSMWYAFIHVDSSVDCLFVLWQLITLSLEAFIQAGQLTSARKIYVKKKKREGLGNYKCN